MYHKKMKDDKDVYHGQWGTQK